MIFYLGTHCDYWLDYACVPLFVSARRLRRRKGFPRAADRWALDSGGFSELSLYGRWVTGPAQYAEEVRLWSDRIGSLDWAAIQDWMCEPFLLAKTGLAIAEHQRRTVQSYLDLSALAPEVPWVPVLQGWTVDDYCAHLRHYEAAGVDLAQCQVVGIGSICRRQATAELAAIVGELALTGLPLHGFGVKMAGLASVGHLLASADSLAWSRNAREEGPREHCPHGRWGDGNCANCLDYALEWREKILATAVRSAAEKIID